MKKSSYSSSKYNNNSYIGYKRKKTYKYIYNKKNKYTKRKYKNKYRTNDISYQFIKFNSSDNQKVIEKDDMIKRKAPLLSNIGYNLELSYIGKRLNKKKKKKLPRKTNKKRKTFHGIESSIINGYQTIRIQIYKEIKCIIDKSGKVNVIPILNLDEINKANINKYQKVLLNYVALDAIVYIDDSDNTSLIEAFNMLFIKTTKENLEDIKYDSTNMVDSNNSIISKSTYTIVDRNSTNNVLSKSRKYYSMNIPNLVNYQSSKTDYIINENSELSICLIPYNYINVYTLFTKQKEFPDQSQFSVNINGYLILTYKI